MRQLLQQFLYHRREVIYKRTVYDLRKAQEREHLLNGFIIALSNIDEVVALIKQSSAAEDAITKLNKRFLLSAEQGKAILEMRLQRLTGMEQEKIHLELEEIKKTIAHFRSIIENEEVLKKEIRNELVAVKEEYADKRRTRIEGAIDILTEADLIPDEEVVVTLTRKGYIKRVALETYGVQHRGGKGKMGMASLEEGDDVIEDLFVARNHDNLLFFTNLGRVYNMQVFEVPEGSRIAKGRAIVNLLPLTPGEHVVKLLCARDLVEGTFIVLLTKNGIIKRTDASEFAHIRSTGIRAVTLREADELVFCALSTGSDSIIIATAHGQGIRFNENEVRSMGRQAAGVIGIRVKAKDFVVGMEVIADHGDILFATQNGYGKRVSIVDFRVAHRGGLGVRTIPADKRNGPVIGLAHVTDRSNLLLIDQAGKIIRLPSSEVRTMGRQAKGVRLIRLDEGQKLSSVVAFEEEETTGGSSTGGSQSDITGGTPKKPSIGNKMDEFIQDESVNLANEQFDGEEESDESLSSTVSSENMIYAKGPEDSESDPFAGF